MRQSKYLAASFYTRVSCFCLGVLIVFGEPNPACCDEITLEWNQIVLNVTDSFNFSLTVEPDESLSDLKRDMSEIEGIPYGHLVLEINGTQLDDTKKLSDYNISDGTILNLRLSGGFSSGTPVEFYLSHFDGRSRLPVTSRLNHTVSSLKDDINNWFGIPRTNQRLLLDGKELRDERMLLHYDIFDGVSLNLARPLEDLREEVFIYVKTLSSARIEIHVNLADTVDILKQKIWDKTGVPACVQHLFANQRVIAGGDHLCDLGLEAGSTVEMFLYSARITHVDQVARLQEPTFGRQVNNHKAPIFRESEDFGELAQGVARRFASFYKDARNWVAREGNRPGWDPDLFDPVAYLVPNPYDETQMEHYRQTLRSWSRSYGRDLHRLEVAANHARVKLSLAVGPYSALANLNIKSCPKRDGPGITIGGGRNGVSTAPPVPLGANINNWAPNAFSDSDVMTLFEVSERVRQLLARSSRTGEGLLSITSQKRINHEILSAYLEALAGYPLEAVCNQSRDDEVCGICMDDLISERSLKLPCEHTLHADCILQWATHLFKQKRDLTCPYCRQRFRLPYEILGKAKLDSPEMQADWIGLSENDEFRSICSQHNEEQKNTKNVAARQF